MFMPEMSWAILTDGGRPKRTHLEDTMHNGRGLVFFSQVFTGAIGISASMLTRESCCG